MSGGENTTVNRTQPFSCADRDPDEAKLGKTFAFCLIFLVSLAGNTAIGIIVNKTKTTRKPINLLIANMAISDLLPPIFLIPLQIQMLYIDSWLIGGPLGHTLCKLVAFLPGVSCLVSIQSLVLITVDRFGALVFPLRYLPISSKLCPFLILSTWIVALAVLSPYLYAMKMFEYPGRLGCRMHWNEVFGESSSFKSYLVTILVVFIFLPFVSIAILYIVICIKLKSQNIPGAQSTNTEDQYRQRELDVLQLAIAVASGFEICWFPLIIMHVLVFFSSNVTMSCGSQFFSSVALLVNTNCAINPCICFIFSRNYREDIRTLLR